VVVQHYKEKIAPAQAKGFGPDAARSANIAIPTTRAVKRLSASIGLVTRASPIGEKEMNWLNFYGLE
jgi:hypothetical protein